MSSSDNHKVCSKETSIEGFIPMKSEEEKSQPPSKEENSKEDSE